MSFTKLYGTNNAADFSPTNFRGAWDDTAGAVTKALDVTMHGGASTTVARAETSTTNNFDVCLYRGVSGPLAAQTITGTIQIVFPVSESNASANDFYHVHVYITAGDTDTVRGTLLTDFIDSSEWATTIAAKALNAAQTLTNIGAITDGDRLVIEIGYQAQNTSATSFTGTLRYGLNSANGAYRDLASGDGATTGSPVITFSNAISESTTAQENRVTAAGVEFVEQEAAGDLWVTAFGIECIIGNLTTAPTTSGQAVAFLHGTFEPSGG